ncbi:putative signal peptide protein [Puccinia sorghi]|uniref:Putative signal peptide protein n=1 Tax=Puccinia sorghi TaxID=27349 RepID=A0A0L6VGF0_9BASI|nr:putative signal peptide protein [Puccinia sorghi]
MTHIISPLSSLRYVVLSFAMLNDMISSTHLSRPSKLSIFAPCSCYPFFRGYLPHYHKAHSMKPQALWIPVVNRSAQLFSQANSPQTQTKILITSSPHANSNLTNYHSHTTLLTQIQCKDSPPTPHPPWEDYGEEKGGLTKFTRVTHNLTACHLACYDMEFGMVVSAHPLLIQKFCRTQGLMGSPRSKQLIERSKRKKLAIHPSKHAEKHCSYLGITHYELPSYNSVTVIKLLLHPQRQRLQIDITSLKLFKSISITEDLMSWWGLSDGIIAQLPLQKKLSQLPAVDMQHAPAKLPSKLHLFAYAVFLAQSLFSLVHQSLVESILENG